MSVPAIASSANAQSAVAQLSPSASHRKHGVHAPSLSDVDAQSSSVATASNTTGRAGGKVDFTV
jgi:hypothetical protein